MLPRFERNAYVHYVQLIMQPCQNPMGCVTVQRLLWARPPKVEDRSAVEMVRLLSGPCALSASDRRLGWHSCLALD
jgi:hypothetical protein